MASKRVGFLDELRGLTIILIVAYHAVYDLILFHSFDLPWFESTAVNTIKFIFIGIIVAISGICCRLSSNNLRRGVITMLIGFLITIITSIFVPEYIIIFGVLSMLGACMVIYGLLEKQLEKIPALIGLAIMIFLFIVTTPISSGIIGIDGVFTFEIPQVLYKGDFLFPFGIVGKNFSTSDYFPLFPYLFIFLSGAYFGHFVKENKLPNFFYKTHIKWLGTVGKYTLWIYLLHQPIIYFTLDIILKKR
jgi:uncharacterized membrane protein